MSGIENRRPWLVAILVAVFTLFVGTMSLTAEAVTLQPDSEDGPGASGQPGVPFGSPPGLIGGAPPGRGDGDGDGIADCDLGSVERQP